MGADDELAGERASLMQRPTSAQGASAGRSLANSIAYQATHNGACRVMLAAAVAGGWMCVSSLLILVNKVILKDLSFG
jgi:hypothetical protein